MGRVMGSRLNALSLENAIVTLAQGMPRDLCGLQSFACAMLFLYMEACSQMP